MNNGALSAAIESLPQLEWTLPYQQQQSFNISHYNRIENWKCSKIVAVITNFNTK